MSRVRKPIQPVPTALGGMSSELKTILVIGAVVVAGAGYAYFRSKKVDPAADAAAVAAAAPAAGAPYGQPTPAKGPDDAPVVLAKFTDFQCPFCSKFAPTLDEIVAANPAIRLEYHHYPLSFHATAEPAAIACMAAHKQGKFVEMLGKVYGNLQKQDQASLEGYAKEIGLDVPKFLTDQKDPDVLRYVRMEQKAGEKIGVGGTPTLLINGKKVEDREKDKIEAAIKTEADAVQALVAGGKTVIEARRARMAQNGGAAYVEYVLDRKPIEVDLAPPKPPPPPKPQAPDLTVYNAEVFADDPIHGPADAPVTIVECTDFQCPFCARATETVKLVQQAYPTEVRVVLHNRPLDFHPNAMPAATAAMAAHKQGKFWEMHDKLFANSKTLEAENIEKYAAEVGLDMAKWKADWKSADVLAATKRQDAACVKVGASGTPAFFINGKKLDGAKPLEELKAVIDEQLKAAKVELAKGIAPKDLYTHLMKLARKSKGAAFEGTLQTIDIAGSPTDGPPSAVATLVIFSDFECPFCSRIGPPVHEAKQKLGDQLRVVFKQNPLNFHAFAMGAAKASLAADRQGKFWQYHDRLFKNQKKLTDADLVLWAKVEGLNIDQFNADRADPAIKAQVDKDMAEGSRIGVQGTPTTFLNGRRLKSPPTSGDALVDLIQEEIMGVE